MTVPSINSPILVKINSMITSNSLYLLRNNPNCIHRVYPKVVSIGEWQMVQSKRNENTPVSTISTETHATRAHRQHRYRRQARRAHTEASSRPERARTTWLQAPARTGKRKHRTYGHLTPTNRFLSEQQFIRGSAPQKITRQGESDGQEIRCNG